MSAENPHSAPTQGDLESGRDLSQRIAIQGEAELLAISENAYRAQDRVARAVGYAAVEKYHGRSSEPITPEGIAGQVVAHREDGSPVTLRDTVGMEYSQLSYIVNYISRGDIPSDETRYDPKSELSPETIIRRATERRDYLGKLWHGRSGGKPFTPKASKYSTRENIAALGEDIFSVEPHQDKDE